MRCVQSTVHATQVVYLPHVEGYLGDEVGQYHTGRLVGVVGARYLKQIFRGEGCQKGQRFIMNCLGISLKVSQLRCQPGP